MDQASKAINLFDENDPTPEGDAFAAGGALGSIGSALTSIMPEYAEPTNQQPADDSLLLVLVYPDGLGSGKHDRELIENAGLYSATEDKKAQLRNDVLVELALDYTRKAVRQPTEADWAHSHLEQEELLKRQFWEEYETTSHAVFNYALSMLYAQYQQEAEIAALQEYWRELEWQQSERERQYWQNKVFPKYHARTQGAYDSIVANNTIETLGYLYADGIEAGVIQRVTGLGRIAGGTAVLVISLGATETGLGAFLGVPGVVWSLDQIYTGGGELRSGNFQDSFGAKGAKVALGDGITGNIAAFAYDFAGGYAGVRPVAPRVGAGAIDSDMLRASQIHILRQHGSEESLALAARLKRGLVTPEEAQMLMPLPSPLSPHRFGHGFSLRNINPLRGETNCVKCAMATDSMLARHPASALTGRATETFEGTFKLLEEAYKTSRIKVNSFTALNSRMTSAGNGARGIVIGLRADGSSHAFNVIVQRGRVHLLDGQIGTAPRNLENFLHIWLIRTN